jgi:hypothetical protein
MAVSWNCNAGLRKGCATLRPVIVKGEADTGSRLRLCDVGSAFPRGRPRAEWEILAPKRSFLSCGLVKPGQYYVNMDMTAKLMSWSCCNYWATSNLKNLRKKKLSIHRVSKDALPPFVGTFFSISWSCTQSVGLLLGRGIGPSQHRSCTE